MCDDAAFCACVPLLALWFLFPFLLLLPPPPPLSPALTLALSLGAAAPRALARARRTWRVASASAGIDAGVRVQGAVERSYSTIGQERLRQPVLGSTQFVFTFTRTAAAHHGSQLLRAARFHVSGFCTFPDAWIEPRVYIPSVQPCTCTCTMCIGAHSYTC